MRDLTERFWEKVDKSGECWNWMAARNKKGYGRFQLTTGPIRAHRLAYELSTGVKPGEMMVLHSCDNPSCVNPAHLSLGTNQDNVDDRTTRGRQWQAKKTHCPKGHEYTPENTRFRPNKGRDCIACRKKVSL